MNIFGGIVDCEMVARGIQAAYEKLKVDVPLIVRLEGKHTVFNLNIYCFVCSSIRSFLETLNVKYAVSDEGF